MDLHDTRVLAFGTTGAQGSGLLDALLRHGARPVRVSSDPARVRVWQAGRKTAVTADLTDVDSLRSAARSTGAVAAVLHVPLGLGSPQGAAAAVAGVAALRAEGLAVAVNLGAPVPTGDGRDLMGTRDRSDALTATGAVVLSPTAYLENHLAPWATGPLASGVLPYPRPAEDVVAWITARDVTAAAVAALSGGHEGQLLRLAGPQRLTFDDLAVELGAGVGRPLVFREVPATEFGDMLRPYVGPDAAASVAGAYGAMPRTPDPSLAPDAEATWRLLGVQPMTARRWAGEVLAPALAPVLAQADTGRQRTVG